jgi:hypothetical protein
MEERGVVIRADRERYPSHKIEPQESGILAKINSGTTT